MPIIAKAAYLGCIPSETCKVIGELVDKATCQSALDAEGGEITAERDFVAKDFEGSVDIEFKADKDNPNAYLYLDALGWGGYGTPHIDADNAEESLLVPVYGHNMSDGSVFADFAEYNDEPFAALIRKSTCMYEAPNRTSFRSPPLTLWTRVLKPCVWILTTQNQLPRNSSKCIDFRFRYENETNQA